MLNYAQVSAGQTDGGNQRWRHSVGVRAARQASELGCARLFANTIKPIFASHRRAKQSMLRHVLASKWSASTRCLDHASRPAASGTQRKLSHTGDELPSCSLVNTSSLGLAAGRSARTGTCRHALCRDLVRLHGSSLAFARRLVAAATLRRPKRRRAGVHCCLRG